VCFTVTMTRPVDRGLATGDFDAVYRRELPAMIALATTMTGDREVGTDIAHEGMVRMYRDWTRISGLERPGAWLRRVVINLAIDAGRQRAREARAMHRLDAQRDPVEAEPMSEPFWRAVRELPERQRAAVALHYLDDMSVAGIADVLGVTVGTIKTSLFKARRSLAVTLGAEEVDG